MPFVKIYIHFVWSTKNRIQTLNTPELRKNVAAYQGEWSKEGYIY